MFFRKISLRKAKKIFYSVAALYHKKKETLNPQVKKEFKELLQELKNAVDQKEQSKANEFAKKIEGFTSYHFPQSSLYKGAHFLFQLAFALLLATLIRQVWFEFYKIPTGSMRPTIREGDILTVSKSAYSLNVPLKNSHFYFDQNLFERGNIIVFSGEGLDISDNYTNYFFIFPGIKQYVKRLVGKPGDSLYFYGGLIYGMDQYQEDLPQLRTDIFEKIEHVPFLRFVQRVKTSGSNYYLYQMNEPIAKISLGQGHKFTGSLLGPYKDLPDYGDIWGMNHYAMVRLLSSKELSTLHPSVKLDKAPFYLEMAHHPSIKRISLEASPYGSVRPSISYETSFLPVNAPQWKRVKEHLTTARFIVNQGKMYSYGLSYSQIQNYSYLPKPPKDLPDGTYEFENGVAYKISGIGDIPTKLPLNHPIYQQDDAWFQLLFNLGIELDTHFLPVHKGLSYFPSRYAYFRDHNLYLMGKPVFFDTDYNLKDFIEREEALSSALSSYRAFVDSGPPLKNGKLDKALIQKFGLTLPENSYLVLGDNHAMSGDSRCFGFVPVGNFKGKPSFIFWPPSSRMGALLQPKTPLFTLPHGIIWGGFLVILVIFSYFHHQRKKKLENLD